MQSYLFIEMPPSLPDSRELTLFGVTQAVSG